MEVKRIETEHGRELMRVKHMKPEGAADHHNTTYKRRAATASHGRFIFQKTCAYAPCGAEFSGIKTRRFCSNACKQANVRAVKAAKLATMNQPEQEG